jgi:predicted permease
MGYVTRIRNLGRRDVVDAEIAAELRAHIEMAVEEAVRKGTSEQQAWRAARLQFGNPVVVRETTMGADTVLGVEGLWRDVKFALRQLRKSPGFAATVIATLGLGIGANTTVFSIVDAVLLRPLPYHQPQRLVEMQSSDVGQQYEGSDVSYPDFFDWRAQNHSFERLVSYHDTSLTLTGVERAVHLDGEVVSADLLPLLGVQPQMGRGFSAADEKQGARVALISHALWVSQFGADASIVGRTMHLSGDAFTVIGVMPVRFRFPVTAPKNSFWTTLAIDNDPHNPNPATGNRGMHFLNVIGRLKPGVAVAQADAEMKAIATRLTQQYPKTNTKHDSAQVQAELSVLLGDTHTLLLVVLGAVGLVLLVACGNIANLLLARTREREREIAVRAALGAARVRIVRQLLAESLVLGLAGGLAGCLLALAATPLVLRVLPSGVPRTEDAGVNLMVLGFALGISLLCGVFFGTIPALMASRTNLSATLQSAGRAQVAGHDWLRSAVIVGQVALGIVLTAGAGLLLTSFLKLTHNNEGFNPDHLLTYRFETPDSRYEHTRAEFYRDYFEKLRALPGVEAASGSMLLPMAGDEADLSFENPEHPVPEGQRPSASVDIIAPEFFRTMQIPLLAGRDFSDADTEQSPQVMMVSEAFAKKVFPGENPLGKKLKPGASNDSRGPQWRTIVGVVGDVRRNATDLDVTPIQYLPASQLSKWCCMFTVARTGVDPASLEPEARNLVTSMDRDIPVTDMRTMRDLIGLQLAQPRFAMVLLATFAGLALLLTLVGLYGVMMYSVARRTREIGVRLALGAPRGKVMQMLLRQAAVLVAAGMAIGIAATLASASVLRSMLYGTGERNPIVLAAVCVVVALTGLLAAYLPALRASGIQPMQALRSE